MESVEKQNGLKEKIKEIVDQVLPPTNIKVDAIKDEIWYDLSVLYYKYEDEKQKKAFREVMYEISDKISDGKWNSVYQKLYNTEQKGKTF